MNDKYFIAYSQGGFALCYGLTKAGRFQTLMVSRNCNDLFSHKDVQSFYQLEQYDLSGNSLVYSMIRNKQ